MRKFIFQSKKGQHTIVEVEVEVILPSEDPSVLWLKEGEYKARIIAPKFFHRKVERIVNGTRVSELIPEVWYSHAFYSSIEEAHTAAEKIIRFGFQFDLIKYGKQFTEQDIQESLTLIEYDLYRH